MPKLIAIGLCSAFALSAGLYALARGGEVQSFPVLTERPADPYCSRGKLPPAEHINVVSRKGDLTCFTMKAEQGVTKELSISADLLVRLAKELGWQVKPLPGQTFQLSRPGKRELPPLKPQVIQDGVGYFNSLVLNMFDDPELAIKGFDEPMLMVGKNTFKLTPPKKPGQRLGELFYWSLAPTFFDQAIPLAKGEASRSRTFDTGLVRQARYNHVVQTRFGDGDVIMLVIRKTKPSQASTLYVTLYAPVNRDGKVTFKLEFPKLRFVKETDELGPYPTAGRMSAMLIRLTNIPLNKLSTGVFVPAQPTSDVQ